MGWQSVVCCGVPLVGSKGKGASVWPRGEQQIGIGVGLGQVPNVERKNGGYQQYCVVIFARFLRGFLGFLGFGVVVELVGRSRRITLVLIIGLIVHTVYDLLPRDG